MIDATFLSDSSLNVSFNKLMGRKLPTVPHCKRKEKKRMLLL